MKKAHWFILGGAVLAGLVVWRLGDRPVGQVFVDEFNQGLDQWVVEQQPGGTVRAENGVLHIDDRGGCTVWFKPKLKATPLVINYEARVLSSGRVSDLNCFWLASEAKQSDLMAPESRRDGKFASYDSLKTYYVGYGGNNNTTTRFRRYDGTGARPLDPKHDLSAPQFLLKPDEWYLIHISVGKDGRVLFERNGELIFEMHDTEPLREGWFGFRTVNSRIEIRNFRAFYGPLH